MKRVAMHVGIVLLALISDVMLGRLVLLYVHSFNSARTLLYFAPPTVVFIWSIVSYVKSRNSIFLTFGISFFVGAIFLFITFVVLIIIALNSFT